MSLVLSRAPRSVPANEPSRPVVSFDLRQPPASEIDRRLAAMLPQPTRLPSIAPVVPHGHIEFASLQLPRTPPDIPHTAGSIQFAALALPLTAPDVPALVPIPVVVPPLSIALRAGLPDDLRPPVIVAMPQIAIAPPPPIPPQTRPVETAQCVAADPPPRAPGTAVRPADVAATIVAAATAQTRDFVIYQARYVRIAYPGGDVPSFYGVCTDVIIRAYRAAGIDLQVEVQKARVGRGDTSIDHRRTETLRLFFARMGETLPITDFAEDFQAGDIVTYYRPQNRSSTAHIALVSDVLAASGRPMIIHNRGYGVQMEDALFVDKITGHYRYRGPPTVQPPELIAAARAPKSPAATRVALRAQSLPGRPASMQAP